MRIFQIKQVSAEASVQFVKVLFNLSVQLSVFVSLGKCNRAKWDGPKMWGTAFMVTFCRTDFNMFGKFDAFDAPKYLCSPHLGTLWPAHICCGSFILLCSVFVLLLTPKWNDCHEYLCTGPVSHPPI